MLKNIAKLEIPMINEQPIKVIESGIILYAGYSFLLAFYSNFEIDGDFSQRSQNFPTTLCFAPPLMGFPLELGIGTGVKKLE